MGDDEDEPRLPKEEPAAVHASRPVPDGKEETEPDGTETEAAAKPKPESKEIASSAAFHNILVTEVLRHVRDR